MEKTNLENIYDIKELKKLYEQSKISDEVIELQKNVYGYKNQEFRNELLKRAEGLLPIDKRLAIYLHNNTCRLNHTDMCGWHYDIHVLEHDWEASSHKHFLEKARKLLEIVYDKIELSSLEEIIDIISKL